VEAITKQEKELFGVGRMPDSSVTSAAMIG
jgi:hypothetical protein